jgi:hypothetical protein
MESGPSAAHSALSGGRSASSATATSDGDAAAPAWRGGGVGVGEVGGKRGAAPLAASSTRSVLQSPVTRPSCTAVTRVTSDPAPHLQQPQVVLGLLQPGVLR